jgi:hypothetical protein
MRHYFALLNILFTLSFGFSLGKTEMPVDCVDIGQLDLTTTKTYGTISLPYMKPLGINKVITSSVRGLIINKIIVDGRIIAPQKTWLDFGAYEAINSLYEEDASNGESQFFMPMLWGTYGGNIAYDDQLSEGIRFDYYSRNGKIKYSPDRYNIPYGSKEVFINYNIRFPEYSNNKPGDYIISEETYTIKFNILWPEIRIADRNGRIPTPNYYENIGVYKFNLNNELIIDLPFNEIDDPHIDNKWLEIYQIIGDGLLINKRRVNRNERRNIDNLTQHGYIKEGQTAIEMLWRINGRIENGILFYSRSEYPPIKYIIPFKCKEVYLIYDVLFKQPNSVGTYTNYNKQLCVKWEIEWD